MRFEKEPTDPAKLNDFGCSELALAIVRQAAVDYFTILTMRERSLTKLKENYRSAYYSKEYEYYEKQLKHFDRFLYGSFYEILTDIHPDTFKKVLYKRLKNGDTNLLKMARINKKDYIPEINRNALGIIVGKDNAFRANFH